MIRFFTKQGRCLKKRNTTPFKDRQTTKDASTIINKKTRTIKHEERTHNIAIILNNWCGLKKKKKTRHPSTPDARKSSQHMQGKAGNNKYERERILRMCSQSSVRSSKRQRRRHEHKHEDTYEQHPHTMKPFTVQELNEAINQLKRGKAQTREESTQR